MSLSCDRVKLLSAEKRVGHFLHCFCTTRHSCLWCSFPCSANYNKTGDRQRAYFTFTTEALHKWTIKKGPFGSIVYMLLHTTKHDLYRHINFKALLCASRASVKKRFATVDSRVRPEKVCVRMPRGLTRKPNSRQFQVVPSFYSTSLNFQTLLSIFAWWHGERFRYQNVCLATCKITMWKHPACKSHRFQSMANKYCRLCLCVFFANLCVNNLCSFDTQDE